MAEVRSLFGRPWSLAVLLNALGRFLQFGETSADGIESAAQVQDVVLHAKIHKGGAEHDVAA